MFNVNFSVVEFYSLIGELYHTYRCRIGGGVVPTLLIRLDRFVIPEARADVVSLTHRNNAQATEEQHPDCTTCSRFTHDSTYFLPTEYFTLATCSRSALYFSTRPLWRFLGFFTSQLVAFRSGETMESLPVDTGFYSSTSE